MTPEERNRKEKEFEKALLVQLREARRISRLSEERIEDSLELAPEGSFEDSDDLSAHERYEQERASCIEIAKPCSSSPRQVQNACLGRVANQCGVYFLSGVACPIVA